MTIKHKHPNYTAECMVQIERMKWLNYKNLQDEI